LVSCQRNEQYIAATVSGAAKLMVLPPAVVSVQQVYKAAVKWVQPMHDGVLQEPDAMQP
jgi:hypothetical protein